MRYTTAGLILSCHFECITASAAAKPFTSVRELCYNTGEMDQDTPQHSTKFTAAIIRLSFLLVIASIILFLVSGFFLPIGHDPSENRGDEETGEPTFEDSITGPEDRSDRITRTLSGPFDIVIRNGRVMDPETGMDQVAHVGIMNDVIVAVTRDDIAGIREIDAEGFVVAPGFIDVTMPGFPSPELYRNIQHWKLTDGVTTALWTHDGWHDPQLVIDPIRDGVHLINWGVGTSINRLYHPDRTHEQRLALLERAVRGGGVSVGASPEYYQWISTEALIDYARVADRYDLWLGLHLRYSRRDMELDGVHEAIEVAETSGAHVHIFHISSTGGTYNAAEALDLLDEARARGVRITADVYPYSYWMTYLNSARFDEGWRDGFGIDYDELFYVPAREHLDEDTFHARRRDGGLTVVPEGTISWEDAIIPALQRDWVFIASDGWSGRNPFFADTPFAGHPRGSGTFATALSLHRRFDLPLMTLLRKITLDPALHMQTADASFARRGRLQIGAYADLTVFDPERVGGGGTILDSARRSEGIHLVIVNGLVAYEDGAVLGINAGRLINRGL